MRKQSVLAFVAVLALPSLAFAQAQTSEQQTCINLLNKGMNKVAGVQAKAVAGCVADVAKGESSNAFDCYDFQPKVETARLANCTAQSEKCTMAPSFGPTNCTAGNDGAQNSVEKLAQDLYSFGPESIAQCEADAAKCKCQAKVWKATYKLLDTRIKTFNGCKKSGLKDADTPFTASTDIENCIFVDPKSQIDGAKTKLGATIDKSCTGIASPFDSGACAGLTGTSLRDCFDGRTRCRLCRMVVVADNLDSNLCDPFDDGILNSSCSD
jgi:hypothetical protein